MKRLIAVLGLAVVTSASCAHDFEPPDRSDRVLEAASQYALAIFDTVMWAEVDVRLTEGNAVYAEECRRCHGTLGMGDTDYARERDLEVPSLVEADWSLAQLDSLRRAIYIGHESGMPVYGDHDLLPREIDAAAAYVLLVLRPDVIGTN
jgi:mono/diheme cytochrome c family protein